MPLSEATDSTSLSVPYVPHTGCVSIMTTQVRYKIWQPWVSEGSSKTQILNSCEKSSLGKQDYFALFPGTPVPSSPNLHLCSCSLPLDRTMPPPCPWLWAGSSCQPPHNNSAHAVQGSMEDRNRACCCSLMLKKPMLSHWRQEQPYSKHDSISSVLSTGWLTVMNRECW